MSETILKRVPGDPELRPNPYRAEAVNSSVARPAVKVDLANLLARVARLEQREQALEEGTVLLAGRVDALTQDNLALAEAVSRLHADNARLLEALDQIDAGLEGERPPPPAAPGQAKPEAPPAPPGPDDYAMLDEEEGE